MPCLTRVAQPVAWIPKHKVGVCACAKCGTTAIFTGVYKALLGHDPFENKDWSGIQSLHDSHVRPERLEQTHTPLPS